MRTRTITLAVLLFITSPVGLSAQTESKLPRKNDSVSTNTSAVTEGERQTAVKAKSPTERKALLNKAAANSAVTLSSAEEALEHHASALKKDIEAFTRRGIDADDDRAKLEADIAKFSEIKNSIKNLVSDAASVNPANREVFSLYRGKIKSVRAELASIRADMQEIVHDLRSKSDKLQEVESATSTPTHR